MEKIHKRCACGSDSFPSHHCPLICRPCRDGICQRSPTAWRPPVQEVPARIELTPLGELFCVSLGFVVVLGLLEEFS